MIAELFADILNPQPVRMQSEAVASRVDATFEARRAEVRRMLQAAPHLKRAARFYPDVPGPDVICTVALRDCGTVELKIPRERYCDGWAIFEALTRLGDQ